MKSTIIKPKDPTKKTSRKVSQKVVKDLEDLTDFDEIEEEIQPERPSTTSQKPEKPQPENQNQSSNVIDELYSDNDAPAPEANTPEQVEEAIAKAKEKEQKDLNTLNEIADKEELAKKIASQPKPSQEQVEVSSPEPQKNNKVGIKPKKRFLTYDHTFEKEMVKAIKKISPQSYEIYHNFFYKEKKVFPYISEKISLFGLYILKSMIDIIENKDAFHVPYKIQLKLDSLRGLSNLIKMWDIKAKKTQYTQDKNTQIIYFLNEDSANTILDALNNVEENSKHITVTATKTSNFQIKEDIIYPVNTENITTFPLFYFSDYKNIMQNFRSLDRILNMQINLFQNKTIIKLIHFDEWTKTKWIKYISSFIRKAKKILTKEEKKTIEFEDAEIVYKKLINNKNINNFKIFIINDIDIMPNMFKGGNIKRIQKIYELIYYGWIRFFIKPQIEKQLIEEFDYNMYSFRCDTKIFNEKSPFLFKPQLFLDFNPFIKDPPPIEEDQDLRITKDNLSIKQCKPESYAIDFGQLEYLFQPTQITWLEYTFIGYSLVHLIKNKFIYVDKNQFYLNPQLMNYFDVLKTQKYNDFVKKTHSAFDSYFAKDTRSFVKKLKEIEDKPF